jgi:(2Fe-2S) ferredoxin
MDAQQSTNSNLLAREVAALVDQSDEPPCVLLCAGKSCRKAKGFEELRDSLEGLTKVKKVKCLDVCNGPVIGVRLPGKTVWFERMRSEKVRTAVVALLSNSAKLSKKLREHRV